jgi:hypothetical protein
MMRMASKSVMGLVSSNGFERNKATLLSELSVARRGYAFFPIALARNRRSQQAFSSRKSRIEQRRKGHTNWKNAILPGILLGSFLPGQRRLPLSRRTLKKLLSVFSRQLSASFVFEPLSQLPANNKLHFAPAISSTSIKLKAES